MTKELLSAPNDASFEVFYPLAQLKKDLVITSDHQDARLKRLLKAAVQIAGTVARCVIVPTDVRVRFAPPVYDRDCYGITSGYRQGADKTLTGLRLPGPVISVTSISEGGTLRASNLYRVTNNNVQWLDEQGRVMGQYAASHELTVVYRAGFDASNPDRETIRQAVFEIVAFMNEHPGEVSASPLAIPQLAKQLLATFWTPHA